MLPPSRRTAHSPELPGLAEPPQLSPTLKKLSDASRTAFKYGNRYGMVAVHRAGLSSWLGNPLTGWQCLVTTTGRRSGLPRHTPLGYLVVDGAAWVLAGYGPSTFWYRNLLDDPRVTLLLPGRPPIAALATEARDPSVRARIIPALARSMALPGDADRLPPDERLRRADPGVCVVRAPGPHRPRGRVRTSRRAR